MMMICFSKSYIIPLLSVIRLAMSNEMLIKWPCLSSYRSRTLEECLLPSQVSAFPLSWYHKHQSSCPE